MAMQTIFITGAARGIGKAAALHFLQQGWRVGAADINAAGLADLATAQPNTALDTLVMDVRDETAVQNALAQFCQQTNHRLDVLLNNAAILQVGNFENIPMAQHLEAIDVNNKGVLYTTYHAFPFLKNTPNACVINMCSSVAHYGTPFEAVYSGTKSFIKNFTEALNLEWERYGIHVCDILPSFTKTPMTENLDFSIINNMGVHLTPEDVVQRIWKATQQKKIHWLVEPFPYNVIQPIAGAFPRSMVRGVMKKVADL